MLEPAVRYERSRPGELVHIDVKKLGRIQGGAGKRWRDGLQQPLQPQTHRPRRQTCRKTVGWEYVHVAVDDYSRLAYAEVLPDEKALTAAHFLRPGRSLLPPPRHQRRTGHHRQRQRLHRCRPRGRLPHDSASATSAPAPTGPKQTAKPNASSAPSSPAGPTARSTAPATNAPQPLTAGSGTTTIDDDTQPSATNLRSPEPTCSGPTSSEPQSASVSFPGTFERLRRCSGATEPTRPVLRRAARSKRGQTPKRDPTCGPRPGHHIAAA